LFWRVILARDVYYVSYVIRCTGRKRRQNVKGQILDQFSYFRGFPVLSTLSPMSWL